MQLVSIQVIRRICRHAGGDLRDGWCRGRPRPEDKRIPLHALSYVDLLDGLHRTQLRQIVGAPVEALFTASPCHQPTTTDESHAVPSRSHNQKPLR